jgi:anaerobic selenocysteine-containing dehydrogenase
MLPTPRRSDIDVQKSGVRFVTVEDTVCAVYASRGRVPPVPKKMLSEVPSFSRMARPPRGERRFPTPSGKAVFTVNELETIGPPAGRLILQSLRSHDQFNTTTYSLNDRYRGVHKGRDVMFLNPEDLAAPQLADGGYVDLHSEAPGGVQRRCAACGSFPFPVPAARCDLFPRGEHAHSPVREGLGFQHPR